ncbi:MAG: hypothetical protein ACYTGN_04920, partial [Planctomycetota bacterium]
MAGHCQRQRGEQCAALFRREVQVVDQQHRDATLRQRPGRPDETGLQRPGRQRLRIGRRALAAQERVEGRDENPVLRKVTGAPLLAEVLAKRRRETALGGRRAAGRIASEQEVQVFP